jgi:hypothetical protein
MSTKISVRFLIQNTVCFLYFAQNGTYVAPLLHGGTSILKFLAKMEKNL